MLSALQASGQKFAAAVASPPFALAFGAGLLSLATQSATSSLICAWAASPPGSVRHAQLLSDGFRLVEGMEHQVGDIGARDR
jgi:hypothetical protein